MTTNKTAGVLFAGAGGSSLGIEQTGYECRWAVEYNPDPKLGALDVIANIHRANFPACNVIVSPVQEVGFATLEPVDLLWASPVCKQFSVANSKGEESAEETSQAEAICKAVAVLQPESVIIENVWQYTESESFRMIAAQLYMRGYHIQYDKIDATTVGVPQSRERLILRACNVRPVRPIVATHHGFCGRRGRTVDGGLFDTLPVWRGWYDALRGVYTGERDLLPTLPDSAWANWQLKRMPAEYRDFLIGGGNTNKDLISSVARAADEPMFTVATNGLRNSRAFLIDGRNATRDLTIRDQGEPFLSLVATSIKTPCRAFLVDDQNGTKNADGSRQLSIREEDDPMLTVCATATHRPYRAGVGGRVVSLTIDALARLQGFPDGFQWSGCKRVDCAGIGNSVPPAVAKAAVESIK